MHASGSRSPDDEARFGQAGGDTDTSGIRKHSDGGADLRRNLTAALQQDIVDAGFLYEQSAEVELALAGPLIDLERVGQRELGHTADDNDDAKIVSIRHRSGAAPFFHNRIQYELRRAGQATSHQEGCAVCF